MNMMNKSRCQVSHGQSKPSQTWIPSHKRTWPFRSDQSCWQICIDDQYKWVTLVAHLANVSFDLFLRQHTVGREDGPLLWVSRLCGHQIELPRKRTRNLLNNIVCTALCDVVQAERCNVPQKEKFRVEKGSLFMVMVLDLQKQGKSRTKWRT